MASDTTGGSAFSRQLTALKRRGCALLVVNDSRSSGRVCERLLGSPSLERRHVFVPTTTTVADVLGRHGPHPRDESALAVVDATVADRTPTLASPGIAAAIDPDEPWYTEADDLTDLDELLGRVRRHVDQLTSDDPDPGVLRLCVESVDPFLDAVPLPDLFQFLHGVNDAVRRADGIGHVHAAAGVDDPAIETIRPLFDVTVRTRVQEDGSLLQRWHIHETGTRSEWIQVG